MKLEIGETLLEGCQLIELTAFTPDGRSFLHLSVDEFERAELIGTEQQIDTIQQEFYMEKYR